MSIVLLLPDRKDLEDLIAKALPAAAVAAVSVITRRTAQGIDMNGAPFRPYTPAYARNKAATGRNASPPDLTLTGQMLRALKVMTPTSSVDSTFAVQGRAVRIGAEGQHRDTRFAGNGHARTIGEARRAQKQRARGISKTLQRLPSTTPMATVVAANHRRRPFFGIRTAKDVETVARAFRNALNAEIRRRNEQAQREANTRALAAGR